ncbi:MAG: tyrosine--tRNA ligase [Candidatus Omnitrophota bacterium]
MKFTVKEQVALIKRGISEIISEEELAKKIERSIKEKKPLKIKSGFDPSAPDIHLGHSVLLRKLKHFQELGHEVYFLIGDFTGRIGDPTGKNELRPQLTKEQVLLNARTYEKQVFKILDKNKTKVVFNSSWLEKLSITDVLMLTSHSTVAQLLARADFKERFQQQKDITILEFMYPLLQGYDSVELHADVELGGTDQKFNLLIARELQRDYKQEPQVIITTPLLEGLDGVQKMSKSLGNYVGIDEPAKEIFGKIMSIPDELMPKYYELLTDVPNSEIENVKHGLANSNLHPRDVKKNLARIIAAMYHTQEKALQAEEEFEKVFKRKELPDEIKEFKVPPKDLQDGKIWIAKLLVMAGFCGTNSEVRRLIKQGGIKVNSEKITDENFKLSPSSNTVIQVGKRQFLKLSAKKS